MYEEMKYYDPKQFVLDQAHELLEQAMRNAMAQGTLPERELPEFITEIPGDVKNGDVASNLAMASARVFGMAPRKIAEAVVAALPTLENTYFERVEIAGPGFINLFLSNELSSATSSSSFTAFVFNMSALYFLPDKNLINLIKIFFGSIFSIYRAF